MKIEKLCLFYVNKAHLLVIMQEYIKDKKDYDIITFIENEIRDESEDGDMYQQMEIKEINCNITKEPYNKKIEKGKNKIILVDGSDEYREKVTKYIKDETKQSNIENLKIINTYDFEENKLRMSQIFTKNEKILYTVGEEIIEH